MSKFVDLNEWQIMELQKSIDEADNEDFASDSEVESTFDKWSTNGN
ncbi:MAG: hypothetical protein HN826_13795 [Methylococcales bacterium]|jgi:hypothetical protein|nr:hypothetical protein [Methylococcales bacterium]